MSRSISRSPWRKFLSQMNLGCMTLICIEWAPFDNHFKQVQFAWTIFLNARQISYRISLKVQKRIFNDFFFFLKCEILSWLQMSIGIFPIIWQKQDFRFFLSFIFNNYCHFNKKHVRLSILHSIDFLLSLYLLTRENSITDINKYAHAKNKPEQRKPQRTEQLHQGGWCSIYFNQI